MMPRTEFAVATTLPPETWQTIHGYNNAGVIQTYEMFDVSGGSPEMQAASEHRKEQQRLFLSGEIRNPILNNCPKLDTERQWRQDMYQKNQALVLAREQMYADGMRPGLEDELVDEMLGLRLKEINFVETAAVIASGELTDEQRGDMAAILKQTARECYGMPDRDDALSVIGRRLGKAQKILEDREHPAYQVAAEVTDMLQLPEYDHRDPPKLTEENRDYYQGIIQEEMGPAVEYAFQEIGKKEIYTPEEMVEAYNRLLDFRQLTADGWRSEVFPNRTACAAKMVSLVVEVGADRPEKNRKYEPVVDSGLHESMHAERQVRGKSLGAGLAEFGLPGYPAFEEPFCDIWAALYDGEPKAKGEPFTMAIALGAGYDGPERDFRDSFEVMWRLALVNTYSAKKSIQEQITTARKQAAAVNLTRIWRGMPTDIPGCVFPKDHSYDTSRVIQSLQPGGGRLSKSDFLRLTRAKYDATNPQQDAYIRSLTT